MKNIFIVAFLFSSFSNAQTVVSCSKETVHVPLIGFTGFGQSAKKDNKIAKLISPSESQDSTFDKSFEIGIYRFVRNDKKWDIYRKDKSTGNYKLTKVQGRFLIDVDQSIWVEPRSDGMLNIRRVAADDNLQKEVNLIFSETEISVQDLDRRPLFKYINCKQGQSASSTSPKPAPLPVNTGK